MVQKTNDVLRKSLVLRMEEERYFSLRKKRVLFLDDDINEGSFAKFFRDLMYLGLGSSVFKGLSSQASESKKPIWVILNSPGGDVLHGLAIYDCIRMFAESGIEINVLSIGVAASMATVILQAGTKRLALPHTQFLVHQVSETILFKTEEVSEGKERVEELERINRIVMGIIAERADIDLEELLRLSKKKDCWYAPEEAKKFGKNGLIDKIITAFPF